MSHERRNSDPVCRKLFQSLSAYIDGEISPDTREKIEAHAARCVPCRVCLETLKQTLALCKALPDPPAPEAFVERLGQTFSRLIRNASAPIPPSTAFRGESMCVPDASHPGCKKSVF